MSEAKTRYGTPETFNTDQGSQFTSAEFTGVLAACKIPLSMDGRERRHDNILVERLWWTVKHERAYLRSCDNGIEQRKSTRRVLRPRDRRRPHQSLDLFGISAGKVKTISPIPALAYSTPVTVQAAVTTAGAPVA